MTKQPRAENNLYALKRQLAAERAGDDSEPHPDRSTRGFDRHRPVRSGCAIGPQGSGYGTLGVPVVVGDPADSPDWMHWSDSVTEGEILLTTNRHVLDGTIGSPVYQPGHKTSDDNRIGGLVGFARLSEPQAPDIAFIRLDPGIEWDGYLGDGMGQDAYRDRDGDLVGTDSRLYGATSGDATGEITDAETTVSVNYGGRGRIAKRHVYGATDNSRGGDSGAPSDDGPGSGVVHSVNFASEGGFSPASGGTASWKVPVWLIERCGVRIAPDGERPATEPKQTMTEQEGGHIVAIEGQGNGQINYRIDAGTLWHSEARGGSVNAGDEITGETPEMAATGVVEGGTDSYRYTGARTVALSRADGGAVTADDVTVVVKPNGKEWIDWTDETLDAPGEEPDPHPGDEEWTPINDPPAIEERPTYGVVDRARRTVESRTRTVRVDRGAWDGDESSDELGSLQAAANYLPARVLHSRETTLEPGVHDAEPGDSVTFGPTTMQSTRGAHLKISGGGEEWSDTVLDARQINTQFESGVPRSAGFSDLHVRSTIVAYGGDVGLSDCRIEPSGRRTPDNPVAFAPYGGTITVNGGKTTSPGSLAKLKNGARLEVVDHDIDVEGALLQSGVGGGKLVIGAGVSIDAARLRPDGGEWDDTSPVEIHDPHGALGGLR